MTNDKLQRRQVLLGGASIGAVAAGLGATAVFAQVNAPVKVGALLSLSKTIAVLGDQHLKGMLLYFDSINWHAGGRKIELIKEDDESSPQVGLQKVRKLVESDKVDLVCGVISSGVALAVVNYIKESKSLFLCSGAGVNSLTYDRVPYLFRTSTSSWQPNYVMGKWVADNVAKELVLSASDYAAGRDFLADFRQGFVEKGGKVIKEIYAPLGTNDFSSYLADIKYLNPPASFNFYAGSDAVRFVKQYAEFGLKDKVRLLASGFTVDNEVLPAQGKAALGILNSSHYSDLLDTPENRAFVRAYRDKYKDYPSVFAEYGYVVAYLIAEALRKTQGDTGNKDRFADAIKSIQFKAPRGPFRIDPATHNVVHTEYIREVVEVEGRLANRIVANLGEIADPGRKT